MIGRSNKNLGDYSVFTVCPNCSERVRTKVKYETTNRTWCASLALFVVFWPLMCVPFCVMEKNKEHYCPNCNAKIGESND